MAIHSDNNCSSTTIAHNLDKPVASINTSLFCSDVKNTTVVQKSGEYHFISVINLPSSVMESLNFNKCD